MFISQFNAAKLNHSLDHPSMKKFTDSLGKVNDIARGWPGFIWKLQDNTGHSAYIRTEKNPDMAINLSVWESLENLSDFLNNSAHHYFYTNRRNWFQAPDEVHSVLWWIKKDKYPTLEEAWRRLEYLQEHGPTSYAFTFSKTFSATDI